MPENRALLTRPRVPGALLHRRPPAASGYFFPPNEDAALDEISHFALELIQDMIGPAHPGGRSTTRAASTATTTATTCSCPSTATRSPALIIPQRPLDGLSGPTGSHRHPTRRPRIDTIHQNKQRQRRQDTRHHHEQRRRGVHQHKVHRADRDRLAVLRTEATASGDDHGPGQRNQPRGNHQPRHRTHECGIVSPFIRRARRVVRCRGRRRLRPHPFTLTTTDSTTGDAATRHVQQNARAGACRKRPNHADHDSSAGRSGPELVNPSEPPNASVAFST